MLLSLLFGSAGRLHLVMPKCFDQIGLAQTPLSPRAATLLSGAAEIAGGSESICSR
ncbi:hypothetical protein [Deinococcus xinjiangensis]|uniref:hypothetical protein n=1 Tax=Deinococcus xinjiangensis TaxID=457454 RepID=UPI0033659988